MRRSIWSRARCGRVGLSLPRSTPADGRFDKGFTARGAAIYDLFSALKRVETKDSVLEVDLRAAPARLYALMPSPIGSVRLAEVDRKSQVPVGQLHWNLTVLDAETKPVVAQIPVCATLTLEGGQVLDRQFWQPRVPMA